ncbi:MAG TPA: hypothetical protein VNA69_18595 [Thermoanaerobaculia bacterium]|nr:hypothetical protein [Thermoanaerobaculia bacterium]
MRVVVSFLCVLVVAVAAHAQSGVGVEVDDVVDNRVSTDPNEQFQLHGSLELRVKLTGKDLEKALAARVLVKDAKDDKGNSLVPSSTSPPDFFPREYNSGTLQVGLRQPSRAASSVVVKGTVELYVPGRDPNASLKIEKALAKLDAPLSSKSLKTAKLEITPLSRNGYAEMLKSRKVSEKDIEKLRAEAKTQGVSEQEVELAIGLAKAFEGMDTDLPEHAVVFSGKKSDFDRIFRLEILGADGNPIHVTSRGTSTRGESSVMTLQPSEAPPANASLQLMLLTDKSRVSFPFELKVQLP